MINYLIGGIIALITLLPFLCIMLAALYKTIFQTDMPVYLVSVISMSSVFILFTIALAASANNKKKVKLTLPESVQFYFKLVPFIASFLCFSILIESKLTWLITLIISVIVLFITLLITKNISNI
jgi:hypothetical protein